MVEKLTITDMQNIATERKGKFLSSEYLEAKIKHKWQCSKGHVWDSKPYAVRSGNWCPHCATYRGEKICREIISKIFGQEFIKCKPEFLRQENKKKLELDGFAENLNLAFEYHGEQHFRPIDYFGGEIGFKETQKRDKIKLDLCMKNGVKIIVVSEFPVDFDELVCQLIVERALIHAGVEIPKQTEMENESALWAWIS